jgi:hypothetical protein
MACLDQERASFCRDNLGADLSGSASLVLLSRLTSRVSSRSFVIDTLKKDQGSEHTEPLAYAYCARDATEPQRADPDEILRSIVQQLSCSRPDLPIMSPVTRKYQQLEEEGFQPRPLSLEECKNLILDLLDSNPAIIIIDALDECDPRRRHELFNALFEILRESVYLVKVMVSSRYADDIARRLEDSLHLNLDTSENSKDIGRFVKVEVDRAIAEKRLLGGQVSPDLKSLVTKSLVEGAQGMYALTDILTLYVLR